MKKGGIVCSDFAGRPETNDSVEFNNSDIMKMKALLICLLTFGCPSSCDVAQQVGSAYNMVNCQYGYRSISNLTLAGIKLSDGVSLTNMARVTTLLSGTAASVPLQFTLNLGVSNPHQAPAAMNGLQYILSIDGVEFTTGSVSQTLNIPGGSTQVLPLSVGFDLAALLSGDSKDAVANITKNFIGIGNRESKVTLQVRPTFMVNEYPVTSPIYIPISFSFGGN